MNLRLGTALCGVLLVWLATMTGLLVAAGLRPGSTGRATVLFPPGWSSEAMLIASLQAGAVPMRDTWLPGLTQVRLDDPGSVERLTDLGALLVLPPVPFEGLGMGGCSWLSPVSDSAPARISKLRAGPL